MRSYPTRFEIVDEEVKEVVAVVDQVDGATASVEIKFAHNTNSWNELAAAVYQCLKAMKLEGDDE